MVGTQRILRIRVALQGSNSSIQAINEQKETFKLIIGAKDKLINEFWEELKKKDDQYTKTLKEQASDIKVLVSKMREQYFILRDQSIRELDEIQRTF